MASLFQVSIKCPICGEAKDIISLGKVKINGLDPMMESYRCDRENREYGDGDKWLTVIKKWKCGTQFFIAPPPNRKGIANV